MRNQNKTEAHLSWGPSPVPRCLERGGQREGEEANEGRTKGPVGECEKVGEEDTTT